MVAPDAYQKGPDTPYFQATFDDCRRVAAHVHLDTTSAAVSPAEIVRPIDAPNSQFVAHYLVK